MIFEIFLAIFLSLAFLGGVLVSYLIFKKTGKMAIEVPKDAPMIDSFIPEYTEGFTSFLEISEKKFPDGKTRLGCYPIDYYDKKEIKKIPIISRDVFIIPFPKGTWSAHKTRKWVLPRKIEHLPKCLEQSPEMAYTIKQLILFKNMEFDMFKAIKEKDKTVAELIKYLKSGEVSREYFQQMQEQFITSVTKSMQKAYEGLQHTGGNR